MATLTPNNSFDTQQPKANNTGIVGGAIQTATPTSGKLPSNVGTSAPVTPNVATYAPTTRQVNQPTDTVQGQVNSILSKDSPLMQRARTLATQQMNQRGLVNSSMAVGAGQAAMVDRALPIAQQDASTYSQVAQDNMNAFNQAGQFNAGEINRFGLQKNEQLFSAGENEKSRTFSTSERVATQAFNAAQQKAQNDFTAAQANLNRAQEVALADKSIAAQKNLQDAQQVFTSAQNQLDRVQQQKLQDDSQAFTAAQNKVEQDFRANQAKLDRTQQTDLANLQIKFQNSQIPATFAANISNTAMSGVNAIIADGSLTADQKRGAIDNLVKYANSQIDWAQKFYGADIPPISAPAAAVTKTSTNPVSKTTTKTNSIKTAAGDKTGGFSSADGSS